MPITRGKEKKLSIVATKIKSKPELHFSILAVFSEYAEFFVSKKLHRVRET
jgi:hypothetical protein